MFRRHPITHAVTALAWASLQLSAWAQLPATDQNYQPGGYNGLIIEPSQAVAQTSVVRLAGLLSAVELDMARKSDLPPDGLTFELRSTTPDGSPAKSVLASIAIPSANLQTTFAPVRLDLVSFNLQVGVGDNVAFVLRSVVPAQGGGIDPFAWRGSPGGSYRGGSAYLDLGQGVWFPSYWDMAFRTFVTPASVPEPDVWVMFSIGIGAGWILLGRHGSAR